MNPNEQDLLNAILDSWDRNNRILINLLMALPEGGLEARALAGSPTVAEMFSHIHYVRLVFLSEDVPDLAVAVPQQEWLAQQSRERIAEELNASGKAVRDAVADCILSGRDMAIHYDHPLLFLQHMIWHEGYHHGQIKLALKGAGCPLKNRDIGPATWRVWMNKAVL